ncbi:cytochrome P450 CYP749A22-like [Olea europaea var. sylvestris]|uniref:cytochrome P450 CYP749A22-like n=1 Tax=Olea europaea var. sylvestris TaxID=158386 RepID=UPI000C1CE718|nr:cytochrome P450 CYP749A22-like [Olea europaea var. sylvestris]
MVTAIIASVESMLEKGRDYEGKEIDVCKEFLALGSEVISKTAFQSSYLEGNTRSSTIPYKLVYVSIFIRSGILSLKSDFLGSLLKVHHDSNKKNRISVDDDDVIDECKVFHIAGHETTSSFLFWPSLPLAIHTDWQEEARKEVLELFGRENPTSECLARMKTAKLDIDEHLLYFATSITCLLSLVICLGNNDHQ